MGKDLFMTNYPGLDFCDTVDRGGNKLGDMLKAGLIDEIGNPGKQSADAIREAVIYLYLGEYISYNCFDFLKRYWERGKMSAMVPAKDRFAEFSGLLLNELLEKFDVEDFEDLVEKLNNIVIPEWIAIGSKWLDDILPDACLVGETLYFLDDPKNRGEKDLFSISIKNISSNYDIYDSINFLGSDFPEILGVAKPHSLYLRSSEPGRFYIYNCMSNDFEIVHGEFCFSMCASLVITKENGSLTARSIYGTSKIVKAGDCERYEKAGSFIKVVPDVNARGFFQPYYLDIYGGRTDFSYEEKKKFLWNYLMISIQTVGKAKGMRMTPEKMDAKHIKESLDETYRTADRCNNSQLVNLDSLLNFMASLMGDNQDLIDILYALVDIDRKMDDRKFSFPSEDLLTNLSILRKDEEKKLMENLLNIDRDESVEYLRKGILSYSHNKLYDEEKDNQGGLIGVFDCKGDVLEVITRRVEEGLYIGNLAILPMCDRVMHGTVSYDARNNSFLVTVIEELSEIQKCRIIEAFNLRNRKKMFLVDKCKNI